MPTRQGDWLYYGYIPTESFGIVFLVLFTLSTVSHFVQAIRARLWWMLPTVGFCGVLEVIGWAARIWSHFYPYNRKPYLIQFIVTILAPTPLLAANFVILRVIIDTLGTFYSRISPKWYAIIFTTSDVLSLMIQAIGGSIAAGSNTADQSKLGGHIALGGIVFQTMIILVFFACTIEFLVRYNRDLPVFSKDSQEQTKGTEQQEHYSRGIFTPQLQLMSAAMIFTTICLLTRAFYRNVELGDGFNGRIIQTQIYFVVLDAMLITLAMVSLNVAHPGILLRHAKSRLIPTYTGPSLEK